jgi:cell division protein FtsA
VPDAEVEEPVGQRTSHLGCSVLLITAASSTRSDLEELLAGTGIHLEGVLAQPVALYRGLRAHLPKKGSTIVIDCGARFTSIMVHRKQRLVHVETHAFGGEDLTEAIASDLGVDRRTADRIKREVDVGHHAASTDLEGQTYLWREVQERHNQLAPAAKICADRMRAFFNQRAKELRQENLLVQNGRVHLTGRGAALGGLPALLREVFKLQVVLGSGRSDRDPSGELVDLMTAGLVSQAADERERYLLERNASGVRQVAHVASGLWAWLAAPLQ